MTMTQDRATAFKYEVEDKIEHLLDKFANGDISREHFDLVYTRYSRQLSIAEEALEQGELDSLNQVMKEIPTMVLHAAIRGKALSLFIVQHPQLNIIRHFGDYELDDNHMFQILDDIEDHLQRGETDYTDVIKVVSNLWAGVCSLEYSTLITLFRNEPSAKQVQELARRHRDFESANRNILNEHDPNPDTLVYPIELFVNASS